MRQVIFDRGGISAWAQTANFFWDNPAIITASRSMPRARSQQFEIAGQWVKVQNKTLQAIRAHPTQEDIWLEVFRARWPTVHRDGWTFPPRPGYDFEASAFNWYVTTAREEIVRGLGIPPHLLGAIPMEVSWDTASPDIRGDLLAAVAREARRTGRPLSDFNQDGTLRTR